jgi:hypothetical protein
MQILLCCHLAWPPAGDVTSRAKNRRAPRDNTHSFLSNSFAGIPAAAAAHSLTAVTSLLSISCLLSLSLSHCAASAACAGGGGSNTPRKKALFFSPPLRAEAIN